MVPVLPLAGHNGPFSRLSESPSVSLIMTEWGRRVTWEETRGTRGPSFTCQEAGIKSTWHGVHTENGDRLELQCCEERLPFDPGTLWRHQCSEANNLFLVLWLQLRTVLFAGLRVFFNICQLGELGDTAVNAAVYFIYCIQHLCILWEEMGRLFCVKHRKALNALWWHTLGCARWDGGAHRQNIKSSPCFQSNCKMTKGGNTGVEQS